MARASITKRLKDPKDVEVLVGLFIEFLFTQPVSTLVNTDHVLDLIDRGLDEELTEDWVRQHLKPLIERETQRAGHRNDAVAAWISPEMHAELRTAAMQPLRLSPEFLRALVRQDSVRHMLRSIIEETLDRFVTTLKPGGSGGGLLGSVGRGALGFANRAGRGILGQIGGQLEGQLRQAATSFVHSSTNVMLDRLVVLLASPETASHLGASGLAAYDAVMALKTAQIWSKVTGAACTQDILDTLACQISFTIRQPAFKDIIRQEMTEFLAIEGSRSIGELLGNEAYRETVKSHLTQTATPLVVAFSQTELGKGWFEST